MTGDRKGITGTKWNKYTVSCRIMADVKAAKLPAGTGGLVWRQKVTGLGGGRRVYKQRKILMQSRGTEWIVD